VVGACILGAVAALALGAEWIAPAPPTRMDPQARLAGPSLRHPFGTDFFGRDLLSRVLVGYRTSLVIATLAVGLAAGLGGSLGVLAGYRGGRADTVLMRAMDVLFAFPVFLLAITIVVILGTGTPTAVLAIGIVYVPVFARIARGPTLVVKAQQYVEAAISLGAGPWHVVRRHVLPNIATPVLVQASTNLATAILFESALSFLGLGVQPPYPSLGTMVSEGRPYVELSPWPVVFPGLAIAVVVLGFNLLGEGLQELLDPRLRADRV
jgi:peptide/nickel transport system permease protein